MEHLLNILLEAFKELNSDLVVFIVSMFPIVELRGGMIAAAIYNIPVLKAFALCIAGNLLPIPFILLFINKIFEVMKKWSFTKIIVEKLEKRALNNSDKISNYEFVGLMLFVGIPLPGTGAWTGALIASLLRLKVKKSFLSITCGVLIASLIMFVVSYGGFSLLRG